MKREIGPFPLTIQKIKRISLNYKVKNEAKNQSLSNPTRRVGLGLFIIEAGLRRFQSLIGILQTSMLKSVSDEKEVFQSLIGILQTKIPLTQIFV